MYHINAVINWKAADEKQSGLTHIQYYFVKITKQCLQYKKFYILCLQNIYKR